MVHEVRTTDAQVENVDFLEYGVVERIEEPRRIGHLIVGEHSEDM